MLKLTKKADYGLMAMKHLAEHAERGACSAKEVADAYHIRKKRWPRFCSAWLRPVSSIRSMARMADTRWLATRE